MPGRYYPSVTTQKAWRDQPPHTVVSSRGNSAASCTAFRLPPGRCARTSILRRVTATGAPGPDTVGRRPRVRTEQGDGRT